MTEGRIFNEGTNYIQSEEVALLSTPDEFPFPERLIRVCMVDFDSIMSKKELKVVVMSEEGSVFRVMSLNGAYYQIGSTIMMITRYYCGPIWLKVESVDNAPPKEDHTVHDVTLVKVEEGLN